MRRAGFFGMLLSLLVVTGVAIASPADAGANGPAAAPVCVKASLDWRAVYQNSGTCPDGYQLVHVTTTGGQGLPACYKQGLDIRAPYNNGTCPQGYAPVTFALGSDIPVCSRLGYDLRAPYNSGPNAGNCPQHYQKVWLDTADQNGNLPTINIDDATGDSCQGTVDSCSSVDAVFTVSLTAPAGGTVSFDYTVTGNLDAVADASESGSGSITAGNTSTPLVIDIIDDGLQCSGTRFATVTLSNIVGATPGDVSGTLTILDSADCA